MPAIPPLPPDATMPQTLRHLAKALGLEISTGLSNLATKVRPDLLRRISPTPDQQFRMGVANQLDALARLAATYPELTGAGTALGGAGLLGTSLYHGFKSDS